jgi:hypothetical protein
MRDASHQGLMPMSAFPRQNHLLASRVGKFGSPEQEA